MSLSFSDIVDLVQNRCYSVEKYVNLCKNDNEKRELWKFAIEQDCFIAKKFPKNLGTPEFWNFLKFYIQKSSISAEYNKYGFLFVPENYLSYNDFVIILNCCPESITNIPEKYIDENLYKLALYSMDSTIVYGSSFYENILNKYINKFSSSGSSKIRMERSVINDDDVISVSFPDDTSTFYKDLIKNVNINFHRLILQHIKHFHKNLYEEMCMLCFQRDQHTIEFIDKQIILRHPEMVDNILPENVQYLPFQLVEKNNMLISSYVKYSHIFPQKMFESKYFHNELIEIEVLRNMEKPVLNLVRFGVSFCKINGLTEEYLCILRKIYQKYVIRYRKNLCLMFLPQNNVNSFTEILFDTFDIISEFI